MCKYCDGEFVGEKHITPITDNIYGIEIMIDGGYLYAFCKSGTKAVAEIHYCPMCGEKLTED